METILGLLLILLPLVFKLVERKLKASGHIEAADTVHEWSELFGEDNEHEDDDVSDELPASEQLPKPVIQEPVSPQPKVATAIMKPRNVQKPSKPMLVEEEEPARKKEKIDPKKLVIYSEIMKPKF